MNQVLEITFTNNSLYERNISAQELANHLSSEVADLSIEIKREASGNMDTGSVLSIIPSSKSLVALAKGIVDWIRLKDNNSIVIELDGKKLDMKNLPREERLEMVKLFLKATKK